ncbi:MAG: hypothetical protein ACOY90_05600 [Candidatus Zhuqueibacterota bacterium]
MPEMHRIKEFIDQATQSIQAQGALWSRFILLSERDGSAAELKRRLIASPEIQAVVRSLADAEHGLASLSRRPADFFNYHSFYWQLRFLADVGLAADELGILPCIHRLELDQQEDGQFSLSYIAKKQLSIQLVCVTAHVTYCLIRLGLARGRTVAAAVNYFLSTQRRDGGWHCDRSRQNGEAEADLPSCPAATIHVLKALGSLPQRPAMLRTSGLDMCFDYFNEPDRNLCEYSAEDGIALTKLRYPPHFSGLDVLNLLDTATLFAEPAYATPIDALIGSILNQWDGAGWLISQKKIPAWTGFDFGRSGQKSSWLTSLAVRAMQRAVESEEARRR